MTKGHTKMIPRLFAVLFLVASGCAASPSDLTTLQQTAGNATNIVDAYTRMNGQHILRALATPDATTAEDNTTAAGGSAVQYTFLGGERVCYECATTDAYVEAIAAASMTASGAKGRLVKATNEGAGDLVCDTLTRAPYKVAFLCSAAGPCSCKVFEVH